MAVLKYQNSHEQAHLNQHSVEVPQAIASHVHIVAFLSDKRHLRLSLNRLDIRLDFPEQISNISDLLIASELSGFSEFQVLVRHLEA